MGRVEAIKELMPFTLCDVYSDNLRNSCQMAIAALREQEQSQWISVEERLPQEEWEKFTAEKDWDVYPVLAVVAYKRGGSYVTKLFYTGENFVDDECVRYTESVTHWMPLPEPPKEGAEG